MRKLKEVITSYKNSMYKCEILKDSISPKGDRLITFKITFPRIILSEFNTHRMFSRNSASSRAIPFQKMVEMVEETPFFPIYWGKDHKGMQAKEWIQDKEELRICRKEWGEALAKNLEIAKYLNSGRAFDGTLTKQICNRLLEPFMWHTVIITSGEEGLENFFKLRCPSYEFGTKSYRSKRDLYLSFNNDYDFDAWPHEDPFWWLSINTSGAEIHIQEIAAMMWDSWNKSTPEELPVGEWHMPYGDSFSEDAIQKLGIRDAKLKISVARCARISYYTLGESPKEDYEADLKLYDRLLKDGHMSPFEHCARVMSDDERKRHYRGDVQSEGWCYNFKGWIQHRWEVETGEDRIEGSFERAIIDYLKNPDLLEDCVICGKQTVWKRSLDINMRVNYIEGAGQLCDECGSIHY